MKFPERLSKERQFLLSKEDRAIYEEEWKGVPEFPSSDENPVIFEDVDQDENSSVMEQLNAIYEDIFKDVISDEQMSQIRNELMEELNSQYAKSAVLLEYQGAEGWDHTKWIPNTGWLGKLAIAGLGLLGTGIAMLASDVKARLAMVKLKKYFNVLVEIIDQGVHKKRSWWSFWRKKKHRGEFNTSCFRFIQETSEREMVL